MPALDKSKTDAKSPDDRILEELEEAQAALKDAEAKLARHQASVKLEEELPKLLDDYESQYSDLRRDQKALEEYKSYEEDRLRSHLDAEERRAIERIEEQASDEIEDLGKRIERTDNRLSNWRKDLADKKKEIEDRKAELDEVKKAVASIRDRLKQAEAKKADVEKAYDAKDYARAYWLLSSNDKLTGLIDGQLRVLAVKDLAAEIRQRSGRYSDAIARTAATEAKIKAHEALLKADQDRLVELKKSLDDRIVQRLADLPKSKTPAPEPTA